MGLLSAFMDYLTGRITQNPRPHAALRGSEWLGYDRHTHTTVVLHTSFILAVGAAHARDSHFPRHSIRSRVVLCYARIHSNELHGLTRHWDEQFAQQDRVSLLHPYGGAGQISNFLELRSSR